MMEKIKPMRSCIVLTSFLLERVNSKAIITYHTGEVYQNLTRNAMRRGGDCATSRHAAGRIRVYQNELVLQKTGLDTFSLNQGVQGSSPWRCTHSSVEEHEGTDFEDLRALGSVLFLCVFKALGF